MFLPVFSAWALLAGVPAGSVSGPSCSDANTNRWTASSERPAQRGRDITASEHHAFPSELVEMRRFDRRMPHETIVGVTLVIGDNQDELGGFESAAAAVAAIKRSGSRLRMFFMLFSTLFFAQHAGQVECWI